MNHTIRNTPSQNELIVETADSARYSLENFAGIERVTTLTRNTYAILIAKDVDKSKFTRDLASYLRSL